MARARKTDKKNTNEPVNIIDLGQSIGLTLMTDSTASHVSDWLPTMMPSLDAILGGGIPFGRVTEIYGKEQSGKSTLAVHLTKMCQRYGVPVIWADIEGTASEDNLTQLGVDVSKLFLIQPEEGATMTIEMVTEKMKEIIATFGQAKVPAMVIWDSLASTATEQQLKEGYNPNQMGVVAKAISNMTIQIGQSVNQNNIAFVILNQARDDLKANPMYPQIKSTGGRAMEHWGSLRLEVAKASQLKEKRTNPATGKVTDEYVGHIFRVKTKKSKVSTPNQQAEVFLISDPYIGFDFVENVYRASTEQYGLISKGAWRSYVTDNGEELKMRDKDWVPYLRSAEGRETLHELHRKQLLVHFPNGFAPLDNDNIDVTVDEYLMDLPDYYEEKANQVPVEPEAPTEEA